MCDILRVLLATVSVEHFETYIEIGIELNIQESCVDCASKVFPRGFDGLSLPSNP